ncbi:hypothetical protein [Spirosoma sp.]|uniref:hypothetical protein n=1 Tax=Spirosoma sp. TaxID=1899569 RepID=UPI003B3B01FE
MKLTWTFYPKGESQSITLTVVYYPDLDSLTLSSGGYLYNNTAYVDWQTYKLFDSADVKTRRDAFQRLEQLPDPYEYHKQKQQQLLSGVKNVN